MARIDSKTNWVPPDRPVPVDFNRIENNNEQAFNEIDQEKVDRAADILVETNNRISADNNLQNNITAEANARISADNNLDALKISKDASSGTTVSGGVSPGGQVLLPAGTYYFTISTIFPITSGNASIGPDRGFPLPIQFTLVSIDSSTPKFQGILILSSGLYLRNDTTVDVSFGRRSIAV